MVDIPATNVYQVSKRMMVHRHAILSRGLTVCDVIILRVSEINVTHKLCLIELRTAS